MKYYSEMLDKKYDTVDALNAAEGKELQRRKKLEEETAEKLKLEKERLAKAMEVAKEAKAQKEKQISERKEMANEVESTRKAYSDAKKAYEQALLEFCKKYGFYHSTIQSSDVKDFFGDPFESLFASTMRLLR